MLHIHFDYSGWSSQDGDKNAGWGAAVFEDMETEPQVLLGGRLTGQGSEAQALSSLLERLSIMLPEWPRCAQLYTDDLTLLGRNFPGVGPLLLHCSRDHPRQEYAHLSANLYRLKSVKRHLDLPAHAPAASGTQAPARLSGQSTLLLSLRPTQQKRQIHVELRGSGPVARSLTLTAGQSEKTIRRALNKALVFLISDPPDLVTTQVFSVLSLLLRQLSNPKNSAEHVIAGNGAQHVFSVESRHYSKKLC